MKVSLNTIKQYIDFQLPPVDELVQTINEQLGGVEEVIDLGAKYNDAKIVKVVQCEKHANADKLSVCMIDAGMGELVQVVCGAPNVHADMWAVWLPPESVVPSTFDDDEPFVLGARELRGVMSNGMLASARELGIGDDHDGIIEVADADVLPGVMLTAGAQFADVFGLNDTIIDIENKMFTHRPDLFGQLGVAREIAGIHHEAFTSPDWYIEQPTFDSGEGLALSVFNEAGANVERIMFATIKDVEVGPSPLWLRCAIVAMGGKPINNIVDTTNYIMLLTAQPTHAYDYDTIRGARIGARMAASGEKVALLNGKTYELTDDDVVIADAEGAIGLGGIMGGSDSEVSLTTKNIVVEVANFNMYTVRKSSMRHGLFTDALTRFNKGQSPLQNAVVMKKLIGLIEQLAGGAVAGTVFDEHHTEQDTNGAVIVSRDFINERLGLDLAENDIRTLLENVEMRVEDGLSIRPPFWRTDIELPEDAVEEVGRLYGFDKLPRELPKRSIVPASIDTSQAVKRAIRTHLASAGANELLTYSFVHERLLKYAGQDPSDAYRLSNALSPDLQYYRLSVLPSLLDKVHGNIKAGFEEFLLYETGKSHSKRAASTEADLPDETRLLDMVYASKTPREGAAFYLMRRVADTLMNELGIAVVYVPVESFDADDATARPFDPARSAYVQTAEGAQLGIIGELKPATVSGFKLPDYTAAASFRVEEVAKHVSAGTYRPLSKYPGTTRDVTFVAPASVRHADLTAIIEAQIAAHTILREWTTVSRYVAEEDGRIHTTLRFELVSHDETLTTDQANDVIEHVVEAVTSSLDAQVV